MLLLPMIISEIWKFNIHLGIKKTKRRYWEAFNQFMQRHFYQTNWRQSHYERRPKKLSRKIRALDQGPQCLVTKSHFSREGTRILQETE